MYKVVIVDRPQPFRKNGVGRYLLEITEAVDQLQRESDLRVLYLGRELTVAKWREAVLSNATPSKWSRRLNEALSLPLALWRSSANLIHYPYGNLHPQWDAGDVPRILTLHGMGKYLTQSWYKPWQKQRAPQLQKRFKRGQHKLAHVIAVSEFVKTQAVDFLGLSPDFVEVIPNGVDFDRFYIETNRQQVTHYLQTHLNLESPYLFHLGPGGPRKNVLRQVQAFAQLKKRFHLPHKLVFAGLAGHGAVKRIRELATQLRIDDDVITFGEIRDDKRLRMLYNGADTFLFPSLYEGFGIPVLEAMACGVPVITSNSNSLPEASGKAAALVDDPTSVDNLAHVIQKVLEDSDYHKLLRERGVAHVGQYSWEACARAHLQVYQRVLQDKF